MRQQARRGQHAAVDFAAQHGGDGRRVALVVADHHAGGFMASTSAARWPGLPEPAELKVTPLGLAGVHQVGQRLEAGRWVRADQQARRGHHHQRLEVAGLEWQPFVDVRLTMKMVSMPISTVWPSGALRATCAVPMLPAAPGLFSTTTGCLKLLQHLGDRARDHVRRAAGQLLTKVIGLVGKPCALAALATRLNVAADGSRRW